MNIIFINRRSGRSVSWNIAVGWLWAAGSIALIAPLVTFLYGIYFSEVQQAQRNTDLLREQTIASWQSTIGLQQDQLAQLSERSKQEIDALTLRLGRLQAQLVRLDSLGMRLTEVTGIDSEEFDFTSTPALGGPVENDPPTEAYSLTEVLSAIELLEVDISERQQQLSLLDDLYTSEKIQKEMFLAGRPIKKGWLSSYYGYRTDPFNGKRAWHSGIDFAGKDGTEIIAVAAGVVTYADDRYGYGNLVEITHGNGLVTRYGHCKTISVKVGDVVQRGQQVALMGSSGRSTGPHVHFEVLRYGKNIDPTKYIRRASR